MSDLKDYVMPDGYGTTIGKCLTSAEIQALLAAERERCAKVADQMGQGAGLSTSRLVLAVTARAIRNLPAQTEGGQS